MWSKGENAQGMPRIPLISECAEEMLHPPFPPHPTGNVTVVLSQLTKGEILPQNNSSISMTMVRHTKS